MELLLQQVLAGLATGAIYASMALAVVMIYQAIDHLNFAQGEMAMFSTFLAWQLMQWGWPYWGAFFRCGRAVLPGRRRDRADLVQAASKRAGPQPVGRVYRPLRHSQQLGRLDLGFQHQDLPDAVRLG